MSVAYVEQAPRGPLVDDPSYRDFAGFPPSQRELQQIPLHREFNGAIHHLTESDVPGVADNAERTLALIEQRCVVVRAGSMTPASVTSRFDYLHWQDAYGIDTDQPRGAPYSYYPTITLNTQGDLSLLETDLVRTSALAAQYPNRGFEGRARNAYNRAIDTQIDWLNANNVPAIPDDPRTLTRRDELVIGFLGSVGYVGDVGFRDWKRFVAMCTDGATEGTALETIGKIKDSLGDFLQARVRHVPFVVKVMSEQPSFRYSNVEQRARNVAVGLFAITFVDLESGHISIQ